MNARLKEQECSFSVQDNDARQLPTGGAVRAEPIQVRGRFLTAIAIRIEVDTPDASFFAALDEKIRSAANLMVGAPILLDFEKVPGFASRDHLGELVRAIRAKGLLLFGVQNATPEQQALAEEFGLIQVLVGRDTPVQQARAVSPRRSRLVAQPGNKVIHRHVRSGQLVVAERGDLTIIGSVASGAEVLASGNIHIYGTLRGRAMAGVEGDTNARIFCSKLEAELLAIAGLFKTSETIHPDLRRCNVQAFLEDETLHIERLV
ncbi:MULTISPECIES: septum site-determining protein MinC [Pseudosulfitobacter]|uniref:septum site-determining protein MinC n=1 Tax=Pseudosulfitobacter pseudonitzschiae TaxID=1402135 RepID=UPI001CD367CF|nr:septum site-determining protein MinC [Pseudosulfitobacter pseudonitzschiae]